MPKPRDPYDHPDPRKRKLREGEGYRKSDGRYTYRYTELKKTYYVYAKSLDELRKKEQEVEQKRQQGLKVQKKTLNAIFDEYIETKNLKHTTKTNYIYMWNKFVRDSLGLYNVDDLTADKIDTFYRRLLNRSKERQEGTMSISTLDSLHTLIHPTLQKAVRKKLIPSNPSDGLMKDLKQEGYTKTKREALTLQEQTQFLEYVKNSRYKRWYNLFIVAFGTALRVGELIGLRWEDCDFINDTININHQLVYSLEKPSDPKNKRQVFQKEEAANCKLIITTPKTETGIREIHMFPEVKEALLDLKKSKPKKCPVVDGYTNFIFLNRFGDCQTPSTINRAISRIVRDCNLEEDKRAEKENRKPQHIRNFTCHIIRHSGCTRLFEAGAELAFMKHFMGHADIQTTIDIYTDLLPEKAKELSQGLEEKFTISKKN